MNSNNSKDVENCGATSVETLLPSHENESKAFSVVKKRASSTKKTNNDTETGKIKRLRRKKLRSEKDKDPFIKYGSLSLLVAQMVGLVLLMRYTRTSNGSGDLYLSSTAVFCMEVIKFIICNAVLLVQSDNVRLYLAEFINYTWNSPVDMAKLCVPSFLYTVQNNLLYLALTNLDAATYQVCYQLKILTTAIFSVVLLKRQFSKTKWMALVILTIGVSVVNLSKGVEETTNTDSHFLGMLAVFCASCTSGFSGVYFEKILKGSTINLWIRNIQMGLPSIFLALGAIYVNDYAIVKEKGFFVGYSPSVWAVVIIQAVGGLIVALVVKYADNVLKVFATSFSIILSCIISAVFFDFRPSLNFVFGSSLVMISTIMYSKPEKRIRRKLKKPILPTKLSSSG